MGVAPAGGGKKSVWHVGLVPWPAAAGSIIPTASWTCATARCRGFYACYLVLCVNIELNYNPIHSNGVERLDFFSFSKYTLQLYSHLYHRSTLRPRHTWKWIKLLRCNFFFPVRSDFCSARSSCVWNVYNAANHRSLSFALFRGSVP